MDTQFVKHSIYTYLQIPDYLNVVKHPMDFSTMRHKAKAHQYQTLDQFENDFSLMVENCLAYNERDTVFYRAAIKLRDVVSTFYEQFFNNFSYVTGVLYSLLSFKEHSSPKSVL